MMTRTQIFCLCWILLRLAVQFHFTDVNNYYLDRFTAESASVWSEKQCSSSFIFEMIDDARFHFLDAARSMPFFFTSKFESFLQQKNQFLPIWADSFKNACKNTNQSVQLHFFLTGSYFGPLLHPGLKSKSLSGIGHDLSRSIKQSLIKHVSKATQLLNLNRIQKDITHPYGRLFFDYSLISRPASIKFFRELDSSDSYRPE